MWKGFAPRGSAHLYERYLRQELFPRLKATITRQGYVGYHILTRAVGEETEFTTLVWFTSIEAIKAFTGEDFQRAVVTDTAAAILSHWDEFATHHDLAGTSLAPAP